MGLKPRVLGAALALAVSAGAGGTPARAAMDEQVVDIGGLSATYTRPQGAPRAPHAVIIAGSGPTDRDGNNQAGLRTDTYKLLAHALAERGIATVRYDKRGVGGSAALLRSERDLTVDLFAADAVKVATWTRERAHGAPLVLIGHSEGGVVALLAAKRAGAKALVLLATPGRPYGVILREQFSRPGVPRAMNLAAVQVIGSLEQGKEVPNIDPALALVFRPTAQPFLISIMKIDPAERLRALHLPTMVVGGGLDVQIGKTDFDALTGIGASDDAYWDPTMGHTLKEMSPNAQSLRRAYTDPTLPLSVGLAERIGKFISDQAGS
ncbi:MAG TPA: alpha/beta fold hydrolase [Hyphomicrobiaceae bacterium]|jgi:pimeloyl-ACP methyl ester carboxylesterase|nr:alpha/beta fold hydrolase [Hyphomicrobiaceae bacterium]